MRKNLGVKPYFMPLPVLLVATYNEDGSANAMNAAYGTLGDFTKVSIYIGKGKRTIINAMREMAFTVSFADEAHMVDADYVGMTSGNKVQNKLAKTSFETAKSEFVNAPVITNLPMTIECELIDYDEVSENLIGEIKNISIDEKYLREDGSIDTAKMNLIFYNACENTYNLMGEKLAKAYDIGKKYLD